MKTIKTAITFLILSIVLFGAQTNFTSCKKEIIHDTIVVRDTVSCYNLLDGLVAYYNFNNGSLSDSSGKNNNINFNNAVKTSDRFGKANNAYLFNGSSSYMTVPNSTSLNPTTAVSLMAIVKINGFYSGNCVANQIFGKGWNDFIDGHYALRFSSTVGCGNPVDTSKEFIWGAYGNYSTRNSAGDVTNFIHTNTWYNVVYTYEAGVGKFYLNGTLVSTYNRTTTFTPNTQELFIGKHGDPTFPYWFNGVIDEIRIYGKALCEGEVKELNNLKH